MKTILMQIHRAIDVLAVLRTKYENILHQRDESFRLEEQKKIYKEWYLTAFLSIIATEVSTKPIFHYFILLNPDPKACPLFIANQDSLNVFKEFIDKFHAVMIFMITTTIQNRTEVRDAFLAKLAKAPTKLNEFDLIVAPEKAAKKAKQMLFKANNL